MRFLNALLIGLGLIGSGFLSIAQTSAQKAADAPRVRGFEYLGTLKAETGTRAGSENVP